MCIVHEINGQSEFASASFPGHSVLAWKVHVQVGLHTPSNCSGTKSTITVFERNIPDNFLDDKISEIEELENQFIATLNH